MATVFLSSSDHEYYTVFCQNQLPRPELNGRGPLLWPSLTDFDLVRSGHEPVSLVRPIAEGHQRGPAASAPGLYNLSVHND